VGSIVLPERPVILNATVVVESHVEAIAEAGRLRPGLFIITDGARQTVGR
jgi:hypothetical protein